METNKTKQLEISVYSQVSINKELIDVRVGLSGLSFGTVSNICQQYGIKYEKMDNCWKFTAPKYRLQMFVEKLHFALIPYSEKPY